MFEVPHVISGGGDPNNMLVVKLHKTRLCAFSNSGTVKYTKLQRPYQRPSPRFLLFISANPPRDSIPNTAISTLRRFYITIITVRFPPTLRVLPFCRALASSPLPPPPSVVPIIIPGRT